MDSGRWDMSFSGGKSSAGTSSMCIPAHHTVMRAKTRQSVAVPVFLTTEQPIAIPGGQQPLEETGRRHSSMLQGKMSVDEAEILERHISKINTREIETGANWNCLRIALAEILNSTVHRVVMSVVIATNVIAVILETDAKADPDGKLLYGKWITTYAFLAVYTLELMARLYVLRSEFWQSLMNIFDFTIVFLDVLVEVLENAVGDLPSISVFRVFRVLRFVRIIRQFLVFRELYLMVQSLVGALRAIVFATLLLASVLTLWSIIAVELVHQKNVQLFDMGVYGDCALCRDAFAGVMRANYTFVSTLVAGDNWAELALPLMLHFPEIAWVMFGSLLSVQLGLLNLIVAIIVDRALQSRTEDDELMQLIRQEQFVASMRRLIKVFNSIDSAGSGVLTKQQIQDAYEKNEDFAAVFANMGVSQEDIGLVFEVLDKDNSGDLNYEEFVEQLHILQNFNSHITMYFVRHHVECIRDAVASASKSLAELKLRSLPTEKARDEATAPAKTRYSYHSNASEFPAFESERMAPPQGAPSSPPSSSPSPVVKPLPEPAHEPREALTAEPWKKALPLLDQSSSLPDGDASSIRADLHCHFKELEQRLLDSLSATSAELRRCLGELQQERMHDVPMDAAKEPTKPGGFLSSLLPPPPAAQLRGTGCDAARRTEERVRLTAARGEL